MNTQYARPTESDLIPGFKHIVKHKDYLQGQPALLGLRMRPVDFLKMLAGGWTQERLCEEYELTPEVFQEIYRFAAQELNQK